jgi:two-component system chemotaxis response regulator CheY
VLRRKLRREMAGERVLVVDDEQDIREFLELALESQGYRVTTADNGAVALERVTREPIDLVLLDMRMPVMDGWAFAQAYRQHPGHHAPIVVITAATNAAARAAEIRAQDYVAKPFDLDDLLTVLARHARR